MQQGSTPRPTPLPQRMLRSSGVLRGVVSACRCRGSSRCAGQMLQSTISIAFSVAVTASGSDA